jgi:hypothetical protein
MCLVVGAADLLELAASPKTRGATFPAKLGLIAERRNVQGRASSPMAVSQ